ncbi:carbohydrate ABC transporter permease [Paenibacillus ferrarius]|uniref:carbohydrate ABC transporter permease n=1 Tax=Paenibacillus ferrarius TaxID=1469647 RepID=UPI003D2BA85A
MQTRLKWLTKLTRLRNREGIVAAAFLLPSSVGFAVFFLIPFLMGGYYSLVDTPIDGSFVGFANYEQLLANPIFRRAAMNTLQFMGLCVPLNMGLALGLAMLLNRSMRFREWFRIALLSPLVIPVASVVLVWTALFDLHGTLSGWLDKWGHPPQDWLESGAALYVIILVYIWKNVGYNMILFLAGLQQIPADYYEAAAIDGAGKLRQWRSITLVYLTPTTFFVFMMSIVNSFKMFRETYMLAGSYPAEKVYMLQHYMNNMFQSLDYQKLTSAAYTMAVVITVLVWLLFQVERKLRSALE